MAIDIEVKLDPDAIGRELEKRLVKQVPFAAALALTRTAKKAQEQLVFQLPRTFTIRSRWVARGIRIKPARKTELFARVGSKDDFMKIQALGGTKRPRHGSRVAVPQAVRRRPSQQTTRRKWPSALLAKPRHFLAPLEAGDKRRIALFRRRTKKRYPLQVMYVFPTAVRVPKRWDLDQVVRDVVRFYWQQIAHNALRDAVRKAR